MTKVKEKIAGIIPIDLSQAHPFSLNDLLSLREDAKNGHKRIQSEYDCRMAGITLGTFPYPPQRFLLTDSLIDKVMRKVGKGEKEIPQGVLLVSALEETTGAVHPSFSADAINDINASYYSTPLAFLRGSGAVTMHAENKPINSALGKEMAKHVGKRKTRVKELASGRLERWKYIAEAFATDQQVDVTLTDFVKPDISSITPPHSFHFSSEQHDLFTPLPPLAEKDKVDVLLVSYGFDSVWLPDDMLIARRGDTWFQYLQRVRVSDHHPKQKTLLNALRKRQLIPNASTTDYEGIFVEDAVQEIDLTGHPFERYIKENIANGDTVNVPGGLIRTVTNAFDTQLRSDGMFIIGDVSEYGVGDMKRSSYLSGVAARFKAEDYSLAKIILEKHYGFTVELLSQNDFVKKYGGADWESLATENEKAQISSPKNSIMVIRK